MFINSVADILYVEVPLWQCTFQQTSVKHEVSRQQKSQRYTLPALMYLQQLSQS